MTALDKPITRVVDFGRGPTVITIDKEYITFRPKGARWYVGSRLDVIYARLVAQMVEAERATKPKRKRRI